VKFCVSPGASRLRQKDVWRKPTENWALKPKTKINVHTTSTLLRLQRGVRWKREKSDRSKTLNVFFCGKNIFREEKKHRKKK